MLLEAKDALQKVIRKGRVHLYKPIQIAEILYRHRVLGDIDLGNLDDYRIASRRWRDEISLDLVGNISTSSIRYQDDVFNENAVPPRYLVELGKENVQKNGIVEAYIYSCFYKKRKPLVDVLNYVQDSNPKSFKLDYLLNEFRVQAGLRRSIDKVYEVVVYALFDTLVEKLEATITLQVNNEKVGLISEFEEFTNLVLGINQKSLSYSTVASLYRVGVANAADRGLDMWANFGPAIQVKHLSLDLDLAENIVNSIAADQILIVCKDCDQPTITTLLKQIGWGSRIRGIIVESQLISWYKKALIGEYSQELANTLLEKLNYELAIEFPAEGTKSLINLYQNRGYDKIDLAGIWEDEV